MLARACGTGLPGACAPGSSGASTGSSRPARLWCVEACNGADDDCDGAVDEGDAELLRRPPETRSGRCRASQSHLRPRWRPRPLRGRGGPGVEVCPGVDEDCDGRVDGPPTRAPPWAWGPARGRAGWSAWRAPRLRGRPRRQPLRFATKSTTTAMASSTPPTCEVFASCQVARDAGHRASGVPPAARPRSPRSSKCGATRPTTEGGWARVAASRASPLQPAVGPWHGDLARPSPEGTGAPVAGLAHLDVRFDLRLGCAGPRGGVQVVLYASEAYPALARVPGARPLASRDLATGRWRRGSRPGPAWRAASRIAWGCASATSADGRR
ncbi:MAG: MopE-related protein [bacterium]